MTLFKEYIEIKNKEKGTHLKFSISFNKDTYHWATSSTKEKGYQLIATPVSKSKSSCGTYSTESFTAFEGFYKIIYPVGRQSNKRLDEAIRLFKEDLPTYLEYFKEKGIETV